MDNTLMEQIKLFTLSTDSSFILNKQLLLKLGPKKALFITNLIDKYKYSLYDAIPPRSNWFHESYKKQAEEIGVTENSIKVFEKYFQKCGVLQINKQINSTIKYYSLNLNKLKELIF